MLMVPSSVLYLILNSTGLFTEIFVRGKLVVPKDVLLTAQNIADLQLLWRMGIACDLIGWKERALSFA